MTRDASGKSTIRAIKLTEPLRLDGALDEAVYQTSPGFGGLVQISPRYGEPSTEKTEIWVMFDQDYIYVSARCWDSAPPEKWIANELRRDTNQMRQNDHFGVGFDTFYDRRSGFMFYANPIGGFSDYSVVDEGAPNSDWNGVWSSRTGRFDGGWTVEMGFPFKSLRYTSGPDQVWGIQFRRSIRHKNEWTYWTPVPQNMQGPQALNRVSSYGTVVGLDLPPAGRNIEIKPYALGKMTTDRLQQPATSNDRDGEVGGDLKYGVTANLTADLTVNTDFAQVEIDEQQVNLTRFNLFLPEKREFFLEGRGLFDFGRGGGSGGSGFPGTVSDQPYLFYSRRIGLNRGRVVPIDVGGRLTGKIGAYGVGVMNIQAGDEAVSASPATNFTVLRVKRDILRRSTIGAMFTNRNRSSVTAGGTNQAYGVDAALGFYQNVSLGAYYARTETTGLTGDHESYQGKFDWVPDRYGLRAEVLKVGKDFNPEVGFLRRTDFTRSFAAARFSPRPQSMRAIRKFTYEGLFEYFENGAGQVESRTADRTLQRRVRQQRYSQRRGQRQLRPPGRAVLAGDRRDDRPRRLSLQRPRSCRTAWGSNGGCRALSVCRWVSTTTARSGRCRSRRAASRSSSSCRSSRACRSTGSSCRRRASRRGCSAPAPITAFRPACSRARCCSTAPPTAPSAATSASVGSIVRAASSSWSGPTSRTRIRSSRRAAASP